MRELAFVPCKHRMQVRSIVRTAFVNVDSINALRTSWANFSVLPPVAESEYEYEIQAFQDKRLLAVAAFADESPISFESIDPKVGHPPRSTKYQVE